MPAPGRAPRSVLLSKPCEEDDGQYIRWLCLRRDPLRNPGRSGRDVELPLPRLSASRRQRLRAVLVAPKSAVSVRGEPRYHRTVGRAGHAVERGFCGICGSQGMIKLERLPDVAGGQAGSLADPPI